MAARVPVVAVAAGGPLDIVDHGVTGLLAESGSPSALADSIADLLSDGRRRERMAAAAERRCREMFTAERMAQELTSELEAIRDGAP